MLNTVFGVCFAIFKEHYCVYMCLIKLMSGSPVQFSRVCLKQGSLEEHVDLLLSTLLFCTNWSPTVLHAVTLVNASWLPLRGSDEHS